MKLLFFFAENAAWKIRPGCFSFRIRKVMGKDALGNVPLGYVLFFFIEKLS